MGAKSSQGAHGGGYRIGAGAALAGACALGLLGSIQHAWAQSNQDAYFDYLNFVCFETDVSMEFFFDVCLPAFPSGPQSGPQGAFSAPNVGAAGAPASVVQSSAGGQAQSVKERLEEVGKGEEKGAGASADFSFGNWGLTVALQYADSDREPTARETGYDSELRSGLLGLDYRFSERLVVGALAGLSRSDSDYLSNGGSLDTDGRSLLLYASYVPTDNIYLGAYAGAGRSDLDTRRNVGGSQFATGSTEAHQRMAGVSGGYDWYAGRWAFGPFASVDFVDNDTDAYAERGTTGLEFAYRSVSTQSLTSSIGLQASRQSSFGWGTLVPELRLAWMHEHRNDADSQQVAFVNTPATTLTLTTDSPDRNWLLGTAGVTADVGGVILFLNYERQAGHEYLNEWAVSAGLITDF